MVEAVTAGTHRADAAWFNLPVGLGDPRSGQCATLVYVKFLCGRPGCGRESTATLQIDAISETVSLVDPKVSRDGVPLCPRHADATSPPLGWAMNDLRSTSQALSLDETVDDEASKDPISATPPRVRPPGEEFDDSDKSTAAGGKRGAGSERGRQSRLTLISGEESDSRSNGPRHMSQRQSIQARAGRSGDGDAIESRPSRRRETVEEEEPTQESFAFSFDFDDEDEPEALQASTPLLSRAFRSGSR